jgi:hypothetical protein
MGLRHYQNQPQKTPDNDEKRSSWYLLTGLIIGLILGLVYSWWINPVKYNDTSPATLKETYKNHYRSIIAQVYSETEDLTRAKSRLALLRDEDPILELGAQAQRILAQGGPEAEARALALLAAALQTAQTPTPGQPQPLPTLTAAATETPPLLPTQTLPAVTASPQPSLTPTEIVSFELESQERLCDSALETPMLHIFVYDSDGLPVPGVALRISWMGGDEQFFTGLKPQVSPGFADYELSTEETYALTVADGSPILDLSAQECTDEEEPYWGGWTLIFQTP